MFGLFKPEKKKEKKGVSDIKDYKKDNFTEKAIRTLAAKKAKFTLYRIYDVYKKAHGMASSYEEFKY